MEWIDYVAKGIGALVALVTLLKGLIPNEGGWRGWRVGLGVGVEVFT